MKKLLTVIMALACFALTSYAQKNVEKQLIGKWCNPYTYQSTGELKGFHFQKNGKAVWERVCGKPKISIWQVLLSWKRIKYILHY